MDTARRKHKTSKKVTPPAELLDAGQPQEAQPMRVVQSSQEVHVGSPPVESAPVPGQPVTSMASLDPLTDFKEKMNKEELPVPDIPHKKNFMWPILFIVFLALALLAGIFIYKQGVNKQEEVNVVTLVTPTVIPEPSKAEIDLSKYSIEILNGSEIDGAAGKQKDSLEGEGFTVSTVGNAENSDYTKTIIQAKENVDKDFLDKLKSVLEKSFVLGETEELPKDAGSDVIVIIGSLTN